MISIASRWGGFKHLAEAHIKQLFPYKPFFCNFPGGALSLTMMFLTGYLSTRIKNIRILLLIACYLPVIRGCTMIWKSQWTHHAAALAIGFMLLRNFSLVASSTVVISMANVAGASKESFTASTIFVGCCVGNVSSLSCSCGDFANSE